MRLYLDCCCYNRPFDDQSQNRIHDESEAILSLLNRCRTNHNVILDSAILRFEISQISILDKKNKVLILHQAATEYIHYSGAVKKRAEEISALTSIHPMDALHLASAEAGKADVFLSTDDRLIKNCKKIKLPFSVMNPVFYLAEVIENDEY